MLRQWHLLLAPPLSGLLRETARRGDLLHRGGSDRHRRLGLICGGLLPAVDSPVAGMEKLRLDPLWQWHLLKLPKKLNQAAHLSGVRLQCVGDRCVEPLDSRIKDFASSAAVDASRTVALWLPRHSATRALRKNACIAGTWRSAVARVHACSNTRRVTAGAELEYAVSDCCSGTLRPRSPSQTQARVLAGNALFTDGSKHSRICGVNTSTPNLSVALVSVLKSDEPIGRAGSPVDRLKVAIHETFSVEGDSNATSS